jgi:hypothetical protein
MVLVVNVVCVVSWQLVFIGAKGQYKYMCVKCRNPLIKCGYTKKGDYTSLTPPPLPPSKLMVNQQH